MRYILNFLFAWSLVAVASIVTSKLNNTGIFNAEVSCTTIFLCCLYAEFQCYKKKNADYHITTKKYLIEVFSKEREKL